MRSIIHRIVRWFLEGGPDGPVIGGNRWPSRMSDEELERGWWRANR